MRGWLVESSARLNQQSAEVQRLRDADAHSSRLIDSMAATIIALNGSSKGHDPNVMRWVLALRRVAGALEEAGVMAARPEDIANGVRQLQMRAHIAETALSAVAKAVDRTGQRIQNADGFWVPPTAEQLPEAVDNLHQNLRAAQERADELRGANGWLQQQLLEARDALSRESR
jgi:hypothetical protein